MRSYVARTMPRLKYFNDVLITDADKEHSLVANNTSFEALIVDQTQQMGLKKGSGQGSGQGQGQGLQEQRPGSSENHLHAVRAQMSQREEVKSSHSERENTGRDYLPPSYALTPTQQHVSLNTSHLKALQYPVTSYDHLSSSFSTSSPLRSTTAYSTSSTSTNLINLFGANNLLEKDNGTDRGIEKNNLADMKNEKEIKRIEIEKNKKDQEVLFKFSVEKYFRKIIHDTVHNAHRL